MFFKCLCWVMSTTAFRYAASSTRQSSMWFFPMDVSILARYFASSLTRLCPFVYLPRSSFTAAHISRVTLQPAGRLT